MSKEEPYEMNVNYEGIEVKDIEKRYKETAIYNAALIVALVRK
ncbi:DUF4825 domain-containing protein [Pontibacillus halophilus]